MNASIRPAAAHNFDLLFENLACCRLKSFLHGRCIGLTLPSTVIGTIVRNLDKVSAHLLFYRFVLELYYRNSVMQNSFQTRVKSTLLFLALVFCFQFGANAQRSTSDLTVYRAQIDSLYQVAERLCKGDSTGKLASPWVLKSNTLLAIMDDAQLKEKYKETDLHVESAKALTRIVELDKTGEYRMATESNLATSTIDLSNLGREALEISKRYNSPADAEKAASLFQLCLETYKLSGKSQTVVDRYWAEEDMTWEWIRFYKAVSYRKADKPDVAEKEYNTLIKIGWTNPLVFLELADLYKKTGKVEDARKLLEKGNVLHSENIPVACALARIYIEEDQVKKAMAILKPLDQNLGSNSELVLTKALVYEKKADFKKAEVLFKALHKSDPNEVQTNSVYAGFLMRKAKNAEAFDAEDLANKAYALYHHASELSPENKSLLVEMEEIKRKYPKVRLEDSTQ